jgi:hypothetical protein
MNGTIANNFHVNTGSGASTSGGIMNKRIVIL